MRGPGSGVWEGKPHGKVCGLLLLEKPPTFTKYSRLEKERAIPFRTLI